MKKMKGFTALALAVSLASATVTPQGMESLTTVQAASKLSLNKKSATIKVGKSVQLKVKGTKKKVKWSSSNNKIAKVSQKGKVTGKKKGTVKITAKVSKRKLTCKVKVVSAAKATPTITPTFPNVPTHSNTPIVTNAPVKPEATGTTRPTSNPSNPTTSRKPESTATATAPVSTFVPSKEDGKQVSLALDFYLDAYDPTCPDSQFVEVNFVNHLEQDVVVETEAYVTTRGENYPALLLGKPEGETVTISPTDENDIYGTRLTYDSWDYVQNGNNCTMLWLPLDANSTLTFFFRVGNQRYKATINFDQKGALYYEASDSEQLEPFTSAVPTTTPKVTVTPSETDAPLLTETPVATQEPTVAPTETPVATQEPTVAPTATPEATKEPIALDLQFFLFDYSEIVNNHNLWVNFYNNLEESVVIEEEAYVTTRGENYPALISNNETGGTKEIAANSYDFVVYDSWDWVKNDNVYCQIPIDENSTLTFFFRVGNQRYKATINFDQNGGLYYKADDTEQLEGFPYQGDSDTTTTE